MKFSRFLFVSLVVLMSAFAPGRAFALCDAEGGVWVNGVDGCVDTTTGLEWSEDRAFWGDGSNSYSFASADCASIGYRLPTKSEALTAAANGISDALILGGNDLASSYFLWWTTTPGMKKGKELWGVDLWDGYSQSVLTARSYLLWICVRKAL